MVKKSLSKALDRLVKVSGGGTLNLGCEPKKYHFNTFDALYEFHKNNQDKKLIITPIENKGYDVEVENIECKFSGVIGGRKFKESYSGEKSRY